MGEPCGAGCRLVRTNSGEGSRERWVRKSGFQGAVVVPGLVGEECVVMVDMVRRRWVRRVVVGEAMLGRWWWWLLSVAGDEVA